MLASGIFLLKAIDCGEEVGSGYRGKSDDVFEPAQELGDVVVGAVWRWLEY